MAVEADQGAKASAADGATLAKEEQPGNLTIRQLIGALTLQQAWTLGGCIVVIIVGCVALGGWMASARNEDKIAEKNHTIQDLKNAEAQKLQDMRNAEAQNKRAEAENAAKLDGATRALKAMEIESRAIAGKAEFLERYLAYKIDGSGRSKALFANHVCALWKQWQEYSIHIDSAPLNLSDLSLRAGVTPEVRRFLRENGVPDYLLDQASGGAPVGVVRPFPQTTKSVDVNRNSQNAIANVQKIASQASLKKIVRFRDGSTYQVPDEVALVVHSNQSCAPR